MLPADMFKTVIFNYYKNKMYVCMYVHLRNRKHVPCFYRVIQTRVEVWENEKCCGNTSRRRMFPQLFRVLPNFHECLYNSIETRSTCFLFHLENTATRKRKINNLLTVIIKGYILFARAIITSTARASSVSIELLEHDL